MGAPEKFPEHPEIGLMVPGVALNIQRSSCPAKGVYYEKQRESQAHILRQTGGVGGKTDM